MQSEPSDSNGSSSPRALQKEAWFRILPVPLGELSYPPLSASVSLSVKW